MKKTHLLSLLLALCVLLSGCGGGREIEEYLFPVMLGLDAAGNGQLMLTVKALSGNQTSSSSDDSKEATGNTGYITLSATGDDYVQALMLLCATVPRTLNFSQVSEVVVCETLARSEAFGSILEGVLNFFQFNGNATLVVCTGRAEEVLEKQQAYVGTRVSKYLEILLEKYQTKGTIPSATVLSVERALYDSTISPLAVYVAVNEFGATVPVPSNDTLDTLPGHLDRHSPNPVEYMGSAVFSSGRMAGTLTGSQTQMLRLLAGDNASLGYNIDGTEYTLRCIIPPRRKVLSDTSPETLYVRLCLIAEALIGQPITDTQAVADALSRDARALIEKLQTLNADALGFGRTQIVRHLSVDSWEAAGWGARYGECGVQADVYLTIPQR